MLVVALVAGRNVMLDHAASAMKTGEFNQAATKLKALANVVDSRAQSLLGDLYAYGRLRARVIVSTAVVDGPTTLVVLLTGCKPQAREEKC